MARGVKDIGPEGDSSMQVLYTSANEDLDISVSTDQKGNKITTDVQWGSPDTKLLFDKLEEYLPSVGPMKKFKCKRLMWKQIGLDIFNTLGFKRTDTQCENRYKTIMKRKKNFQCNMLAKKIDLDGNRRKGFKKTGSRKNEFLPTEYLLPNDSQNDNFFYYYSVDDEGHIENDDVSNKIKSRSIQDTMLMIHQMKEEGKERRHQEKMNLIKELINVLRN